MEKPVIAAFDFDGTVTKKDTLWLFLKNCYPGLQFYIKILPYLASLLIASFYKNSIPRIKQKILYDLLTPLGVDTITRLGEKFYSILNKNYIRMEAISKIEWHKTQGHKIIMITASLDIWVRPWATINKFDDLLCTESNLYAKSASAFFTTPNCNGVEKVKRFLCNYPDRDKYRLIYYGDSNGDKPIGFIADEYHYRSFD